MSKKFKYAVIGVVIISFMFFGIYSTILSKQFYVAKVDGVKITHQEFNRVLSQRKQQILSNVNQDPTSQKELFSFIESTDFKKFVLNEMVNERLLSLYLKENNIPINTKTVAKYIQNSHLFQKDGKFDTEYFKKYLTYMQMSEFDFTKNQIPLIEQSLFNTILSSLNLKSNTLFEKYAQSLKRSRNVDILTVNIPKDVEFTEDELEGFYHKNANKFKQASQHYVTISYVDDYINQNINLFNSIPQDITQYYNPSYTGKTVNFYYTAFEDESEAIKVHTIATKQGISLQSLTETILKQPTKKIKKHGLMSSAEIDDPAIINAIKDLKMGNITPVVKYDQSFVVMQITGIKESQFLNQESIKNNQMKIIQERKCHNVALYIEHIQKELESGATFESIALKYGLPISEQVYIDSKTKNTKDINTNKEVSLPTLLLNSIVQDHQTQYGKILNIDPKKCSYVIYKQNRIEKERIKTLPEVRGMIIDMYKKEKAYNLALKKAQGIMEQINSLKVDINTYKSEGVLKNITYTLEENINNKMFTENIGTAFMENKDDIKIITINNETPYQENINIDENSIKNIQNIYSNSYTKALLDELYRKYNVELHLV